MSVSRSCGSRRKKVHPTHGTHHGGGDDDAYGDDVNNETVDSRDVDALRGRSRGAATRGAALGGRPVLFELSRASVEPPDDALSPVIGRSNGGKSLRLIVVSLSHSVRSFKRVPNV